MKKITLALVLFGTSMLFTYAATAGNSKAKLGPCVRDCVRAFNPSLADSGADEFLVTSIDMEDCVDVCNGIIVPGEYCYPWTDDCCHSGYENTDPDCGALPAGANCSEDEQCLSDTCDLAPGEGIGTCADLVSYAGTWIMGWVPSDDDCFDDHASMEESVATQDGALLTFTDPNDPMDVKTGELVGGTWTYWNATTTNGETETVQVTLTFLSDTSLEGETDYAWTDGTESCFYHDDIWGWKVPTYDPPADIGGDYELYHRVDGMTDERLDYLTIIQDGQFVTSPNICGLETNNNSAGTYLNGLLSLTWDNPPIDFIGFWAEGQLVGTYKVEGGEEKGTWRMVPIENIDCSIPPYPLKNLGVEFGPYDEQTGMAGAFQFSNNYQQVFFEFGKAEMDKLTPEFGYFLPPDAEIFACMDGVVSDIYFQEEWQDYAIVIRNGNVLWVEHDHVTNLQVQEGDIVTPGTVLGNPGTWWDEGVGRTEVMVMIGFTYQCPFEGDLFDPDLVDEYKAKVTQLMSDWETYKGSTSIYDEANMVHPGCNYPWLTEDMLSNP
jgi:hypothetical protein